MVLPLKVVILFLTAERNTRAAVRVVLPWSMWPMVPTLTCGLVLWKTSLAIAPPLFHCKRPIRGSGTNQGGTVHEPGELLLGVEPRTSSLPRTRSTTELQQRVILSLYDFDNDSFLLPQPGLLAALRPLAVAVGTHHIALRPGV